MKALNKEIILQALASQLKTVRELAIAHEKTIYEPAVEALRIKIVKYFEECDITDVNKVALTSDCIIIYPNGNEGYSNRITLTYRSNYKGENAYVELDTYRADMKSNEDNTDSIFYYNVVGNVVKCFHNISKTYITKWQPALSKLNAAKEEQYDEIWQLEREYRNCEQEIITLEKEKFNSIGVTCKLKDYVSLDYTYENGEHTANKKVAPHSIRAQYGRSKWDYVYISGFTVLNFPKSKHSKVVLEYISSDTDKKRTIELNKSRYAEFINEVYNWQTSRAEEREQDVNERIAREQAKKTA